MYWFSDLFADMPIILRAFFGLFAGAVLGGMIALVQTPGLVSLLFRDGGSGSEQGASVAYMASTNEDVERVMSADVRQAVERAKNSRADKAKGAHALADKYWSRREVRRIKHNDTAPFPITEDCLVERPTPWALEGRYVISTIGGTGTENIQEAYPGLSPFCSSQIPGLRPGLELFALEVYLTEQEAIERLAILKDLVAFPLSMMRIEKVVGFDLALDAAVAETPQESSSPTCMEQSLVFPFEGRQGIVLHDDALLREGEARSGVSDVRYVTILEDEVGGLSREDEVSTVRIGGGQMSCGVASFERVYWGFDAAEEARHAEDLVCAATRLVAWLDCPEPDALFVVRGDSLVQRPEWAARQDVTASMRSKQVSWIASAPPLLDTLGSARQMVQRIGDGLAVSYEVQQYAYQGETHVLTEASLRSDRTCVQGAFEAHVSALQRAEDGRDIRVSFAEDVVGLVDWDGDGSLERVVETPWGSRGVRGSEGLICQVGPPACAVDCGPRRSR